MKSYFRLILLLLVPLALLVAYSWSGAEWGWGDFVLEPADFSTLARLNPMGHDTLAGELGPDPTLVQSSVSNDSLVSQAQFPDSLLSAADTAGVSPVQKPRLGSDSVPTQRPSGSQPLQVAPPDSTRFRILFFGDSMLEGLGKRMADYASQNGYSLTSVIWYSSSTKLWAETDTLQFFLRQIRPDYVMLCLGSNELFVRDLDKRDRYIGQLVDKLSGVPFVWISPPNWRDDTGINQLIINHVGMDRYFDSRHLELERASDHAHPTHAAAALWMDTIAHWMSSPATRHPLRMESPDGQHRRSFKQYVLKPVR